MRIRWTTCAGIVITALLTLFLIVPVLLSVYAGLTVNYARGISAGFTLDWVRQVWGLYSDTVLRSLVVALLTLILTLLIGVPGAYALVRRGGRFARIVEEIVTLPVAIPGLALALAMILLYGGFGAFRQSTLFVVIGHVLFTLPFMMRSVIAILETIDWRTLDEGAASLGSPAWRRFVDVILPNVRPGIVAGALTVVTLSIGEFNLTWMMHTPMTKTLPVGLADAYASMRLEIASAYTLVFLVMVIPLLVGVQAVADLSEKRTKS
ncbi:putative spermidine/putrescine transport system permease protein [Pseudochelatococcus lubricantis]|uniref:Spermidine/putrescine transport system permease protein n=1 Tax=Pseudochelatococcus lubricantis TaxID=1538102 RepID=A0ABX0V1P2_9HYPH|nr:ABC transporter permease subunit [Pseudochelatococcus lubricantis]NIJ59119.1 putative spermidine/putrescine transport system permease protein [Pseudochelatococcus lubricantis]